VDVVVSQWMGHFALFEGMLPSVLLARDRFLAQGGAVLPGAATLHVAPLVAADAADAAEEGGGGAGAGRCLSSPAQARRRRRRRRLRR
jgi:hypothetical protein